MKKALLWAAALCLFLFVSFSALSETWGPIRTADAFFTALSRAKAKDTLLFSGDIDCSSIPLTRCNFKFASASTHYAVLRNLSLSDSSLQLERIRVEGSLAVSGSSEIELRNQVSVRGSGETCGLSFEGNGMLMIGPNCSITGGMGSPGIRIAHTQGDFYASIEGNIRGGDGETGGTALLITSLCEQGTVFLSGSLTGGRGISLGGNALCLYDLSGGAFVTVEGNMQGGDGRIAGDGIQVVSAKDYSFVHVNGASSGGMGESHGGNALMIVRISGSSSVIVAGRLSGGDVLKADGIGGHSLLIADDASIGHTVIRDCMLEDGGYSPQPIIPRYPSITSSVSRTFPLPETPQPPDTAK